MAVVYTVLLLIHAVIIADAGPRHAASRCFCSSVLHRVRSENLQKHRKEIESRPAKEWFASRSPLSHSIYSDLAQVHLKQREAEATAGGQDALGCSRGWSFIWLE